MKQFIFFKRFVFTSLILCVCCTFPFPGHAKTKSVKTSYKRYSIFRYENQDILCEPYIVKKNDWLYTVFKKKGELSKNDFPFFLRLFKKMNPQISSIDDIGPGLPILIPLKRVGKKDYDQRTPGIVDVPVIEFSSLPKGLDLAPFIKKHRVKKGEIVFNLMDKTFLKKGGTISKEGLKAFQLANPTIKNINIIYEGEDIFLPDPSIKSQPWFTFLVSGEPIHNQPIQKEQHENPFKIEAAKLARLKEYAFLTGSTLLCRGKMYFPQENNTVQMLDLSSTPVMDFPDGSKTLILSGDTVSDTVLKNMQVHWRELKLQSLSEIIDDLRAADKSKAQQKSNDLTEYKKIIQSLLLQTNHPYTPDVKIPFMLHDILLEASFGRVTRKDKKDALINFGIVYGAALDLLEKQGFDILCLSPGLTLLELSHKLFSHLEYATWENPSYSSEKTIDRINGLYAVKGQDKFFIPVTPLSLQALDFLKKEGIKILSTKNNPPFQ